MAFNVSTFVPKPYKAPVFPSYTQTAPESDFSRFLPPTKAYAHVSAPQFPPRFLPATKGFASVAAPKVPPPVAPKPKGYVGVPATWLPIQQPDQDDQQYQGKAEMTLPPADPDPFVGCSMVPGLNKDNFWPYINSTDAAFVMFYDPSDPMSALAKLHIRGAARRTKRPNHKYVAVDCSVEEELCCLQGINQPLAYKLFSRGSLVGTYNDVENLRAPQIQNYVETSPVMDNSTPMSCKH